MKKQPGVVDSAFAAAQNRQVGLKFGRIQVLFSIPSSKLAVQE